MQRPTPPRPASSVGPCPHSGPCGPGHLQPVQDDDLRRLHLPPSIPVSRDGEEGATVYHLRLQQSNADAAAAGRTDCYQAPPNRTVDAAGGTGGLLLLQSPQHSTSTPVKQHPADPLLLLPLPPLPPPPLLTRRDVAASLAKFRSAMGSKLHPPARSGDDQRRSPDPAVVTDYPGGGGGGGLLSRWRAISPDRLERASNIIPSAAVAVMGPTPRPPSLPPPRPPVDVVGSVDDEKNATEKRPKQQPQQQRSSSADSVRRLVARCSFLRLSKKHHASAVPSSCGGPSTKPGTSKATMAVVVSGQSKGGFDGSAGASAEGGDGHSPDGDDKEQEAPPWELPPNYVDMIFTKDPATIDNKREKYVIKQQQQQQRPEQRQPRQTQHCCFNS